MIVVDCRIVKCRIEERKTRNAITEPNYHTRVWLKQRSRDLLYLTPTRGKNGELADLDCSAHRKADV